MVTVFAILSMFLRRILFLSFENDQKRVFVFCSLQRLFVFVFSDQASCSIFSRRLGNHSGGDQGGTSLILKGVFFGGIAKNQSAGKKYCQFCRRSFKRGNILGVDLSNSNISFEKLKQFKSKFQVTRLQRPQRIDLNTGQCC